MAKANRQRFNFLTALLSQLEQAASEGDDLYEQFRTFVQTVAGAGDDTTGEGATDRLDTHAQWLAALENRVEDLEQAIGDELGEEAHGPDDGLDDEDMGGVQPGVGSVDGQSRRDTSHLGGASDRQVARRSVGRPPTNGT